MRTAASARSDGLGERAAAELAADGAIARCLDGFAPRRGQTGMAAAVGRAIEGRGVLVCEAGTGTGKTLAYLVPAVLSGRRVIVSTATRTLQDQLFHRDLPMVCRALGVPMRAALLKGRQNYVCLHRLGTAEPGAGPFARVQLAGLERLRGWARTSASGDLAEMAELPEDSPLLREVTSTADNCLGQACPEIGRCFVIRARQAAARADLVVANHHLLLSDMALRGEGLGEVLPGVDAIVVDEAHQLPEVASQFFGEALGSRQLTELARDARRACAREAPDFPALAEAADALEGAVHGLRGTLGADSRRIAWRDLTGQGDRSRALADLEQTLTRLAAALEAMAERGSELGHCEHRASRLAERLGAMQSAADERAVRWVEVFPRAFALHTTPVDPGGLFAARMAERRSAWVFTSATLAVNGSFEHFAGRLGLDARAEGIWESPFDYAAQGLCYVPPGLPDPNAGDYTERALESVMPVLEASAGRAFLLFTSHRALREAAARLGGRVDLPLLIQGDAPRSELLRRFRETPHAVLLGTSSFWEGVDVRGEALSCVVIDRLPFTVPDDPVAQARAAAVTAAGGSPFRDLQLPQAILTLKQGVGRLIRDVRDRGVLVLCDPRLFQRSYGRVVIASLPAFPITRRIDDVRVFFGAPA